MTDSGTPTSGDEAAEGSGSADRDDAEQDNVNRDGEDADPDDAAHLDGIEDGVGCTEIWERLSESREE